MDVSQVGDYVKLTANQKPMVNCTEKVVQFGNGMSYYQEQKKGLWFG